MSRTIYRTSHLFALAGLFVLAIGIAQASVVSHLSGSYRVIQKADLGPQTRVRLQLHLANRGGRDLLIQRMILWNSPHPGKTGAKPCSLLVRTGASISTTQEFTITRSQLRSLNRGTPFNLLVAVKGPGGRQAVELVRLAPISRGRAN
jgi:hypothetical protein